MARMLAIAALVVAFAQPYIPIQSKIDKAEKLVSIYIDNSFSMEAVSHNGSLLQMAKQTAEEIVKAHAPTDKFQLLTNDFEGIHQHWTTPTEFTKMLNDVKISPAYQPISKVLTRQQDMLNEQTGAKKIVYWLSDFQKNSVDIQNLTPDTLLDIRIVPFVAQQQTNLVIDSCWFNSPVRMPNKPETMMVRIRNLSDQAAKNVSINVFLDNIQKTPSAVSIEPNTFVDVPVTFAINKMGTTHGKIVIDDYPITFDNTYYFTINTAKHINVVSINGKGATNFVSKVYATDSLFQLKNLDVEQIDYSAIKNSSLVVLNELYDIKPPLQQALINFMNAQGNLMVIPSEKIDFKSYENLLSALSNNYFTGIHQQTDIRVETIDFQNNLFKNVFDKQPTNIDLPKVNLYYTLSKNIQSSQNVLMSLNNKSPFLTQNAYKAGNIYLLTSPLQTQFSNFAQHALFVPVMLNAGIYSQPNYELAYTIHKTDNIVLPQNNQTAEQVIKLSAVDNQAEFIPEQRNENGQVVLFTNNLLTNAGNYHFLRNKTIVGGVSFNYNRKESQIDFWQPQALKTALLEKGFKNVTLFEQPESLSKNVMELDHGIRLWKYFVLLALLFLLAESLLIRLFR